jgi:predicted DNA-binding protein (UPF0251 family)
MARPIQQRRIPDHLEARVFKPQGRPLGGLERIPLTLDGLEALRLADLQGLYQEEAARRMGVSRATFARILAEARRAIAEALVEGKALDVSGGAVERRQETRWPCPVHGRGRRRGRGCHCRRRGRGRSEHEPPG